MLFIENDENSKNNYIDWQESNSKLFSQYKDDLSMCLSPNLTEKTVFVKLYTAH